MTTRPSELVGMRVSLIPNDYAKQHNLPIQNGRVVDVLFTAFEDHGGMVNDRVQIIVLLDSGRLKTAYVNQLEKEAE